MEKDIAYYMNLPYDVIIERRNDGDGTYVYGRVKQLSGCQTTGESESQMRQNLRDVMRDYLEGKLLRGDQIAEP